MKFANATNLNRKSGGAQWRDLRFAQSETNAGGSTPPTLSLQYAFSRFGHIYRCIAASAA
jgi:hypothetical protein